MLKHWGADPFAECNIEFESKPTTENLLKYAYIKGKTSNVYVIGPSPQNGSANPLVNFYNTDMPKHSNPEVELIRLTPGEQIIFIFDKKVLIKLMKVFLMI